jgi:hypothetical protein
METPVRVFDYAVLGHEPVPAFRTTGGSGAKPGGDRVRRQSRRSLLSQTDSTYLLHRT